MKQYDLLYYHCSVTKRAFDVNIILVGRLQIVIKLLKRTHQLDPCSSCTITLGLLEIYMVFL